MIVFFISECSGKSIYKTRRILDAFANRIGQNTWKTVITQKGLDSVKQLLNQYATKNTSVVCHLIKGNKKTEILWIIGRNFYLKDGIIPVNYTKKEVFMDENQKHIKNPLANTQKQDLFKHLFSIAYVSEKLTLLLTGDTKLAKVSFLAGLLHDIGKIDPAFQEWVNKSKTELDLDEGSHIDKPVKFSFEQHPRHNELSLLFIEYISNLKSLLGNESLIKLLKHTVYWHHSKPIRKNNFETMEDIFIPFKKSLKSQNINIHSLIKESFEFLNSKQNNIILENNDTDINLDNRLPKYKDYRIEEELEEYISQTTLNAKANILRSSLIAADRKISSLNLTENINLDDVVNEILLEKDSNLSNNIQEVLSGFEKRFPDSLRNKEQKRVALELSNNSEDVLVLSGAAGCGKTKIALEYAKNINSKKILFICPRVQVCEGLYIDLTSEEYLFSNNIEIFTGDKKLIKKEGFEKENNNYFSGDIIITTIDQIINSITTHDKIDILIDFFKYTVVFDEFHEYINMPGFNILFLELIKSKQLTNNPQTLLISATPNNYFCKELLETEYIYSIDSFNLKHYEIEFQEKKVHFNPYLDNNNNKVKILISETVNDAQYYFLLNEKKENSILFHSKYTKKDKEEIFNKVFDSFKENGTNKYKVLRSSPIIEASLNISCQEMVTESSSPEKINQRMGRVNRFAKDNDKSKMIIVIDESIENGKMNTSHARFLNKMNIFKTTVAWIKFLENNLNLKEFTLKELYECYSLFYQDEVSLNSVKEDMLNSFKEGVMNINNNIFDPISFPNVKKSKNKIKKNSLRGNNRYVKMAKCILNQDKIEYLDEYTEEELTIDTDTITGFGDSSKSILSFMQVKHKIVFTEKKPFNDIVRLNLARSSEFPIYMSYTEKHLKDMNSMKKEFFQFYGLTSTSKIGIIKNKKIMELENEWN